MDYDHNIIITPKGQYQYDADHDCYSRVDDKRESHWDRWSPIYAVVILVVLCWMTAI
jgi:hypothetical protein